MKENRSMLIPKLVKDGENKLHWMGLWWCPVCTRPIRLHVVGQQSAVDMSLHSDILFWFQSKQTLLLLLNAACFCGEAANTDFIVFGLTRIWLEPTIYHTRGEHANHYITNAFQHLPYKNLRMTKVKHTSSVWY